MRKEETKTKNKDAEIRELKKKINRLEKIALRDELTGLLNRGILKDELKVIFNEVSFSKNHPEMRKNFLVNDFSILFIDTDNFKQVNDNYGHRAGDDLLKAVASIIVKKVRKMDVVGRYSGDEFVVGLVGSDEKSAALRANIIRKAVIADRRVKKYKKAGVTLSIGVASINNSRNISILIDRADKAMYEAKKNRDKNCVVKYSEISG